MQRLALVAKLREGAGDRARELVRKGPPFDPGDRGLDRHAVYLTPELVTFIFECDAAETAVEDLIGERIQSETFAAWTPLLDGPPQLAVEGYYWRRTG